MYATTSEQTARARNKLIILADPSIDLASGLSPLAQINGWSMELCYADSCSAKELASKHADLILIQMENSEEAIEQCLLYRIHGGTASVLVRGNEFSTEKMISAYNAGADEVCDNTSKLEELSIRINKQLQRANSVLTMKLAAGDLILDPALRKIEFAEKEHHLSETETVLLGYLIAHQKSSFSSSFLFKRLWPSKNGGNPSTIRVHMKALRDKLEQLGVANLLRTVQRRAYVVYPAVLRRNLTEAFSARV